MSDPSEVEVAWLAGLLEGEGCFRVEYDRAPRRRPALRVRLVMTDSDVVQKAAALMGGTASVFTDTDRGPRCLPATVFTVNGAAAERVMRMVLPYMGQRRSAKIRECLATPNLSHTAREKADD